ncbi:pseudouridine-5'-phosphate glycosidase [Lentilitoribacter sp. Alg239-R112]|jgi:pseudouridine-5'-phosphate glycosidase|uniref:pseudouridine-5'-phosphate glycosidase n=1 Tax=Lentilitoribacter sp. Alg239-R112 TaxID=2305987 RepID=UPI0013A6D313|nr:pseudouridine-5'-phosphate glycosidase [Lentilitoribacter sp. Alg239-R112]
MQLHFSNEVKQAIDNKAPIVALESTIITHGMPWPGNFEMATGVEQLIRDGGATPATIAVIQGNLHIGLEQKTLEELAQTKDAMKVSRADMAFAISQKKTGATTVAATMMAAHEAGIQVFATGGIGGVHRGASDSFDISADLQELGRTPVVVVAAGAKAILDIAKTLEVLETLGVPIVTIGQDSFPAFWSQKSEYKSPLRVENALDVASFEKTRQKFGNHGGMLVGNPVPTANEISASEMNTYIEQALTEASKQNISGKDVTPFLLGKIFELTNGKSLETNIALVRNNAKIATEIAIELVK